MRFYRAVSKFSDFTTKKSVRFVSRELSYRIGRNLSMIASAGGHRQPYAVVLLGAEELVTANRHLLNVAASYA